MQPPPACRVCGVMTTMTMDGGRAVTRLAPLAVAIVLLSLGACSSSFGGGGSAPAKTYVVLPNGTTEPVQTTTQPPGQ